ncbi:MAG: IS30 family transposase [Alphaproteobacteria bacterium]|nr:IS30 family transposase [Alphaproteobacteria bacterium]
MEKRYKHLTLEDRCTIARLHADEQSWARRWRGCRLMRQPDLQNHVLSHLAMGWSPEQISGRLTQENNTMRISHESIYRFIYAQITRTGDYSWRHYLPRAKSKRGHVRRPYKSMKHIKNRVSIADRPLYINKRCQIGHWETDLLILSDKKHNLLVAQERHTRFTLIAKQDGKFAQPTVDRLKEWLSPLPAGLRRSLTQDNGPEFFEHHQLNQLGIKTYFCDPRSPWQKGGIKNMNGRIRRYIPLKTKPDSFSDNDLRLLASHLNNTPRKCLGYKTPNELFLPQLNPLHFKCEFKLSICKTSQN